MINLIIVLYRYLKLSHTTCLGVLVLF